MIQKSYASTINLLLSKYPQYFIERDSDLKILNSLTIYKQIVSSTNKDKSNEDISVTIKYLNSTIEKYKNLLTKYNNTKKDLNFKKIQVFFFNFKHTIY